MKKYLMTYIEANFKIIFIFGVCILIGLVIGVISFNFLENSNRSELVNSIKATLDLSHTDNFQGVNIIMNGVLSNFFIISVILLATLTVIAPIALCLISLFKGFSLGLYIATIYSIFGIGNGTLVLLLSVILPNIIYIPIFLYILVNAINLHYIVTDKGMVGKLKYLIKEGYLLLIAIPFILLSIIIEQSLIPIIFSIYGKM
ncbi:MAG: hypothetical protein N2749_07110 [Clostridia bacterium]|nr:hypothetical protein [Clostridia bacterium]